MMECYFYHPDHRSAFIDRIHNKYHRNKINKRDKYGHTIEIGIGPGFLAECVECDMKPTDQFLALNNPVDDDINFTYASWFEVRGKLVPDDEKISILDRELKLGTFRRSEKRLINDSHGNFYIFPDSISSDWIANLKIMTFDLETQPNNIQRFSDPTVGDQISMNAVVIQRYAMPETREMYFYIVGDCADIAEFPDCKVIRCGNEEQLIRGFEDLIVEKQPDMICGYNIDKFDSPYLDKRLVTCGKEWRPISRIRNKKPHLIEKEWESKQRGKIITNELDIEGIPTFDIFQWIRTEYRYREYNLGFVSQKLLGDIMEAKKKIDIFEMFRTYEACKKIWQAESPTWSSHRTYTRPANPSQEYLDTFKAIYDFVEYCLRDTISCYAVFEKLDGGVVLYEFSHALGLPIRALYRRGVTARVSSLLYRAARQDNFALTDRKVQEDYYLEGGMVGNPEPGIKDPCGMIDFASHYPRAAMYGNMDYTTLIPKERWDQIPERMCNIFKPSGFDDTGKPYDYEFRFIKPEVRKGLIPKICQMLLDKRARVKKQLAQAKGNAKSATNPTERDVFQRQAVVLDSRQLALKLSANAVYGYTGRRQGKRLVREVGVSITYWGRTMIKWVNDKIIEQGGQINYNDTDSSSFHRPGCTDYIQFYKWAKWLEGWVNDEIKRVFGDDIMSVELEKCYRAFFLGPKYYIYMTFNKDGVLDDDPKLPNVRGVPMARRDKPGILNGMYCSHAHAILLYQPLVFCYNLLQGWMIKILYRELGIKSFAVVKQVGSDYKDTENALNVLQNELSKRGRPIQAGDRVEYILTEGYRTQGYRMWLLEEYEKWVEELEAYYHKQEGCRDIEQILNEKNLVLDRNYYRQYLEGQLDECHFKAHRSKLLAYSERRPRQIVLSRKNGRPWLVKKVDVRRFGKNFFWMGFDTRPIKQFNDFIVVSDRMRNELMLEVIEWRTKKYPSTHILNLEANASPMAELHSEIETMMREIKPIADNYKLEKQAADLAIKENDINLINQSVSSVTDKLRKIYDILPQPEHKIEEMAQEKIMLKKHSNKGLDDEDKILQRDAKIRSLDRKIEHQRYLAQLPSKSFQALKTALRAVRDTQKNNWSFHLSVPHWRAEPGPIDNQSHNWIKTANQQRISLTKKLDQLVRVKEAYESLLRFLIRKQ